MDRKTQNAWVNDAEGYDLREAGEETEHTHTHGWTHIPEGLVQRLWAFNQVFPIETGSRADP